MARAVDLIVLGEFTFKGSYYSVSGTLYRYWLQVIFRIILGVILISVPYWSIGWSNNKSSKT